MNVRNSSVIAAVVALLAGGAWSGVQAAAFVQCPGDENGDSQWTGTEVQPPNVRCIHLTAGDGFVNMADGRIQYIFSFSDQTGFTENEALSEGLLAANFSAPTISVKEGEELYLTLTNVGMVNRPDLSDPHSVHYHGFPEASDIFDGLPEASIVINEGASLTYYYNNVQPGTYMYHCHVEAAEHMQMGMLGNLFVTPAQDGTPVGGFTQFAYNDGDGSTGYDVVKAVQLGSFDPDFHDASMTVQPLPFANMRDRYAMLNGRGYPDTVDADGLPPGAAQDANGGVDSQPIDALITATLGDRILLRISNLNVTNFYTLGVLGLPMQVVGTGARILRGPGGPGPAGQTLYYNTSSVTLGGGESADVIIDTGAPGVVAGTYFLYTTNLNFLSNDMDDFGGMMTEIRIQ